MITSHERFATEREARDRYRQVATRMHIPLKGKISAASYSKSGTEWVVRYQYHPTGEYKLWPMEKIK